MKNVTSFEEINTYKEWLKVEGIPVIGGYYVEDVMKIPLQPWRRTGGMGAYLDLIGCDERTGAYVCEIPPGGSLKPERHLFEKLIYILSGRGTASIWNEADHKQTIEWEEGTLFSPPLNCWHQLFNSQADKAARFLTVTGAPIFMNLFHNLDFIFNNEFVFKDRYAGESDYFSGQGKFLTISGSPVWEGNFIKDVRSFVPTPFERAGKGFKFINLELSDNTMEAHIAEFDPGTYKKAHRHDGGAHITIIRGKGYSLMWPEGKPKQKFDWHEGSIIVPPDGWWHQHFITGTEPARQLALRWHGKKYRFEKDWRHCEKGLNQIEYVDEDPEIRKIFEEELTKEGLESRMDENLYRK